jgi:hypothetical protein
VSVPRVVSRDGTELVCAELAILPGQTHQVSARALAPRLAAFFAGG